MALQKTINHQTGSTSSYWKINKIDFTFAPKTAMIILAGYVNEQARQEDKRHLDVRTFRILPEEYDTYFSLTVLDAQDMNQLKSAYMYIKAIENGEFSDALDV